MKIILITAIGLFCIRCATPLGHDQVEELTTCRSTTISAIEKRLRLAGYEITERDDERLVTGFLASANGYGPTKKYIVVKIDDQRIKFRPVVQSTSTTHDQAYQTEDSVSNNGRAKKKVVKTYTPRQTQRTYAQTYNDYGLSEYHREKQMICGNS